MLWEQPTTFPLDLSLLHKVMSLLTRPRTCSSLCHSHTPGILILSFHMNNNIKVLIFKPKRLLQLSTSIGEALEPKEPLLVHVQKIRVWSLRLKKRHIHHILSLQAVGISSEEKAEICEEPDAVDDDSEKCFLYTTVQLSR